MLLFCVNDDKWGCRGWTKIVKDQQLQSRIIKYTFVSFRYVKSIFHFTILNISSSFLNLFTTLIKVLFLRRKQMNYLEMLSFPLLKRFRRWPDGHEWEWQELGRLPGMKHLSEELIQEIATNKKKRFSTFETSSPYWIRRLITDHSDPYICCFYCSVTYVTLHVLQPKSVNKQYRSCHLFISLYNKYYCCMLLANQYFDMNKLTAICIDCAN